MCKCACGHSVKILLTQCGNYRNLLSHFFDKNFVKLTILLKKLLKSWFHEIFFNKSEFLVFSHCDYDFTEKSTFFPSNQRFKTDEEVTKELISRILFSVIAFFSTSSLSLVESIGLTKNWENFNASDEEPAKLISRKNAI